MLKPRSGKNQRLSSASEEKKKKERNEFGVREVIMRVSLDHLGKALSGAYVKKGDKHPY